MALIKHKVLFSRKNNENSTTPPDPIAAWVDGKAVRNGKVTEVDLEATGTFCWYWDDNRPVECKLYELRDIELPEWLSVDEWISNAVQWKWAWSFGTDPLWPEAWQRAMLKIEGSVERLICTKLLRTKSFRSEFRKSLRDQLIQWIETPASERKYGSPFSAGQWARLCDRHTATDAKRMDFNVYRDRNYCGAGSFVKYNLVKA